MKIIFVKEDDLMVNGQLQNMQNKNYDHTPLEIKRCNKYLYLVQKNCEYFEHNHIKKNYDYLIKTFDYNGYNSEDDRLITVREMDDREKRITGLKNKYIIVDGDHRACLLTYHNISPFKVILV